MLTILLPFLSSLLIQKGLASIFVFQSCPSLAFGFGGRGLHFNPSHFLFTVYLDLIFRLIMCKIVFKPTYITSTIIVT